MGLHSYCIVPAACVPPADLRGLSGEPVIAVGAGRIALWASPAEQRPEPDLAAVRAHNTVVKAAMNGSITPVPSRFGQWFTTESDASENVARNADRWIALLRRFAGRAEYGVRVFAGTGTDVSPTAREMHPAEHGSGTQYMTELARRAASTRTQRDEAGRVAALIESRAGSSIAESRTDMSGVGLVGLAHLVAWEDAAAYHLMLEGVRADEPGLTFLCTGPWPPYTFVE